MTAFKDRLVSALAQQSAMRLLVIGVLSVWAGVGALLVVPVILVGYGIAAFEILRSRGGSRRRRTAVVEKPDPFGPGFSPQLEFQALAACFGQQLTGDTIASCAGAAQKAA
jgi:hypothetical protein